MSCDAKFVLREEQWTVIYMYSKGNVCEVDFESEM